MRNYKDMDTNEIWSEDEIKRNYEMFREESDLMKGFDSSEEYIREMLLDGKLAEITVVTNAEGTEIDYNAAVELMDDDIREDLAREMAPCTEQEFFSAYEKAHEEKYGEAWELSKANPQY